MIGKVPKPGKSFGGCIEYNVLKKDAAILYADGIRTDKITHAIDDFNMQRKMNPGLGQAVGHIALSWSPNDKDKLNDNKMVEIAKEYLQKMKIQDTQILMVRHKDKEHPHLHIVYNRVNNQGKTISDKFQHYNNLKVSKQLTLKHGMYMGKGKEQVNRPQLKGMDKLKYELYDTIKAAIKKVGSITELKNELAKQGIDTYFKFKGATTEIQGVSFATGKYKFKGSEIDRSLSYDKITQAIQQNVQLHHSEKVQHKQFVSDVKAAAQSQHPVFPQQQNMGGKSLIDILLSPDYVEPMPCVPDTDERKKKRKKPSQSYNISR